MRALWTGSISFGLVTIPVKLHGATEEQGLSFDYLHREDKSRIRYERVCEEEGEEVPFKEVVRGYQVEEGEYVLLEESDFEQAKPDRARVVEILSFVDPTEIDPSYYVRPYHLEPGRGADRAYALLREALRTSGKVALARFVFRRRERLAVLRVSGNAIVLDQMRYASELKRPSHLKLPSKGVAQKELEAALVLVEHMTDAFRPEAVRDEYTEELRRVIALKAKGRTPRRKIAEPEPTRVGELMDLLQKSLNRNRQRGALARR